MNRIWYTAGFIISVTTWQLINAAEQRQGVVGETSTGLIRLTLQISEDISDGFVQTNLTEENSEFSNLLSTQLVQSLREDMNTILPLCVMSSGGGTFEVTSFEVPGMSENAINSQFGSSIPITISFGKQELESIQYRSIEEACTIHEAVPVTINLNQKISGEEIGTIYGQFNLLIKSE